MNKFKFVPEFIIKKSHHERVDGRDVRVIDEMKLVSISIIPRRLHDGQEERREEGRA